MSILAPEPVRRSDAIAEELEAMIVSGELSSGDRLDETRLSHRFSVSRTPLREALHRLEASGLIELLPRRGAFVRNSDPREMVEMFEVMAEIEALAGRLAARRATSAQIGKIESECNACREAADDADDYYRANERFHQAIYEASGNAFLEAEAKRLQIRLRPFRRLQLRVRGRIKQSLEEHGRILTAIKAGESDATANALRDHVAIQGERFGDLLASYRSR